MAGKNFRGNRPPKPTGKLREVGNPVNFDLQTPKFCLHHLVSGFGVRALNSSGQAAAARTLEKLSALTWMQIKTSDHKGCGTEFIGAEQIRAPIPPRFQDEPRFMMFRYDGKLPMGGVRIEDVFHILWFELQFGDLYGHGS